MDETLATVKRAPRAADAFRLVWLGCGRQDFLFKNNKEFLDSLTKTGVKVTYHETDGSHVWSVWRNYLHETLPLLFRR